MGEYYEVAHSILLTASQNTTLSTENMISVVEILTTIIIGIISCVVTWRLTLRSVNRMELTYYKKVIEILSNSIHKQYTGLGDLKITYSNEPLDNPSLLLLEIGNTGNTSISHPPISIKAKENTQVRIFLVSSKMCQKDTKIYGRFNRSLLFAMILLLSISILSNH